MGSSENSIAAFHDKLAAAWSANDGTAFAAFFAKDGSLINPFGERADGREALTAMYSEYFGGMLKGTTTSISLTHLRPIGPDHALADAEQMVSIQVLAIPGWCGPEGLLPAGSACRVAYLGPALVWCWCARFA
jgi:uncharacterized protein (TIGR02246 family)